MYIEICYVYIYPTLFFVSGEEEMVIVEPICHPQTRIVVAELIWPLSNVYGCHRTRIPLSNQYYRC